MDARETGKTLPAGAATLTTIGWREWLVLPALGIPAVKAKIDTGARSSTLHAFQLDSYRDRGAERVRFAFHPLRKRDDLALVCDTDVFDRRVVSDSGGHREKRVVIETPVRLGDQEWTIEVTLTNRDTMLFRMLLGRTALAGRYLVDSRRSYCFGRTLRHSYR